MLASGTGRYTDIQSDPSWYSLIFNTYLIISKSFSYIQFSGQIQLYSPVTSILIDNAN